MKITKATVKRINKHSNINNPDYIEAVSVIANILNRSAIILGDSGNYEINDGTDPICWPIILSDGVREYVSGRVEREHEKRIICGLSTRYPRWIQGTFTNGLNGVGIYDVNRLIREITAF